MDKNFQSMINLFAYGATGIKQDFSYEFDSKEVMKYAEEQGIWQIVFYAIKLLKEDGKIVVDDLWYETTNMQLIMSCLANTQKLEHAHTIIKELSENGIKNCIVKGESLSNLYYKPECRISGDVDIYIGNEDDVKACEILDKHGYIIEPKSDDANHYNCMHPKYGEIELHTTFYYKIIHETWFKNVNLIEEPYVECEYYNTLGHTDGCIYVALHAINHFLSSGFGVRHIMDFLLYFNKYYDNVNLDRFISIMKSLKYYHFIEILVGIGKEYFGIDCKLKTNYTKTELEKVINEIYKGGIFGHKNNSNTFEIYTTMRMASSGNINPEKTMRAWRRRNVIKALSFAPSQMYRHYPYSQRNKLLLPIAWCNHIGYIFKTAFTRRKLMADVIKYKTPDKTDETEHKINLLKELDMI